jgi:hypothetical protein
MINKRRNNTQQSSTFSNIKDTIISGFGLGVGNEIAHRAVSSIMGSRTVEIQHSQSNSTNTTNSTNSCQEQMKMYEKCLKKSNQNNCLDELEVYQQCVKSV